MTIADAPDAHPELVVARSAISRASDKLYAIESEAMRLAPLIECGEIPRGEVAETLTDVATAYGHCASDSARATVEHVIREGLAGRSAGVGFSPRANKDALMPSSDWRENTVTAAELRTMKFEPMRYVVPEYVPEGVTLLIGRPKIGKSWLALDVAVACASDRSVLGSLKPVHGDVLYLALEDGKRRLQCRLDKLQSPFRGEWPKRLTLAPMGGWRRADQAGLEDIEAWSNSVEKPVLVVIDTLERFRKPADGRQQPYAADTEAIASLQKIAVKYGIAILVLHHDRKAAADDPFDTVSGTLGSNWRGGHYFDLEAATRRGCCAPRARTRH